MILSGVLLAFCAMALIARAFSEQRTCSFLGFCCLSTAVSIWAFRRLIYVPSDLLTQIQLDHTGVWILAVGCLLLIADAIIRGSTINEPRDGPDLRKTLPIMVAVSVLLMSLAAWTWDGEGFDQLTLQQATEALDRGINPPAAAARIGDIVLDAVIRLQRESAFGPRDAAAIAAYRLEQIKEQTR